MKSKFFFFAAVIFFFLFGAFAFFFGLFSPRFVGVVMKSAGVVNVKCVERPNVAEVVGRVVETNATVSAGEYV